MGSSLDFSVLKKRAKALRSRRTGAEHHLHLALRDAGERRVRRQLVVSRMIIDLAVPRRNLLIEVDGPSHQDPDRDARRDAYLRSLGFNVLRVTNEEVLRDPRSVVAKVTNFPASEAMRVRFNRSLVVARLRATSRASQRAEGCGA